MKQIRYYFCGSKEIKSNQIKSQRLFFFCLFFFVCAAAVGGFSQGEAESSRSTAVTIPPPPPCSSSSLCLSVFVSVSVSLPLSPSLSLSLSLSLSREHTVCSLKASLRSAWARAHSVSKKKDRHRLSSCPAASSWYRRVTPLRRSGPRGAGLRGRGFRVSLGSGRRTRRRA